MRTAGVILIVAGVLGALAGPVLGLPAAFAVLMASAVVLWLVGVGAAAASLVPMRPVGIAASAVAAICGWPMILAYAIAPVFGVTAAVCGVVVGSLRLQSRLVGR